MDQNLEIRESKLIDENSFLEIFKKYQKINTSISPNIYKDSSDNELSLFFRKIIISNIFALYFVTDSDEIIGYFLLTIENKKEDMFTKKQNYLIVEQVYLEKKYRNCGISQIMAYKILQIAKNKGINRIDAEVLYENKISLKFIEKLGGKIQSIQYSFDLNNNES